jgi:hypothetical protein
LQLVTGDVGRRLAGNVEAEAAEHDEGPADDDFGLRRGTAEGKVSIDDHISKSIVGVPDGDQITIRELLTHTSGLADGFTFPAVQA